MASKASKTADASKSPKSASEAGGKWWLVQQSNRFHKIQGEEAPDLAVEPGERMKVIRGSGTRADVDRLGERMVEAYHNAEIIEA